MTSLDFRENQNYTNFGNEENKKKEEEQLKISFLILAHKNFSQVVTFINTLDCEDTNFFIHIDKKSNIEGNSILEELKNRKNVFIIEERQNISWGGYGMVKATLNLLDECLKHDECDYVSLHSGQDLPIKSKYEIIKFLKRNKGKEFMSFFNLSVNWWWPRNAFDRIKYYWLIDEIGLEKSWELYEAQRKMNDKREFLKDIKPYGGWQWWTITKECAEYVINYVNINRKYCDYYKYTLIPDEGFFQTIILNSHFRNKVINNNLRLVAGGEDKMHPKILTRQDYSYLKMSDMLFARKFDMDVDDDIIQMLTQD